MILLNKSDINKEDHGFSERDIRALFENDVPIISVSAKYGDGLDIFRKELKKMMFHGTIDMNDEVYITSARHKSLLDQALSSLLCVKESINQDLPEDFYTIDLMDAYEHLGRIIGEAVEDDLVNEIFSKFCTGK